jgi:putative hydrolase of the HAD superfamily
VFDEKNLMTMRAVIFDIGGVLIRTEDQAPRRQWERRLGLPERGLAQIVFENPVAARATLGQADVESIWAEVTRRLSLAPEAAAQLRADFWAGDRLDHALLDFVRALRPRYMTGVLSNAWPDARHYHRGRIDEGAFDVLVFSAEEGVQKPDPEIYRRAVARLGVRPEETVFVDDFLENVAAARALGMWGVQFKSREQAIEEVEQYLFD